jgi:dUTP pyrophosphatase
MPFKIENGMKIAQMVIKPVEKADIYEVDELSETERGSGGFGSTD